MAQVRKSFTTAKGTELPLLNLKGKEYLAVAQRLVWFREVCPTGIIKTQMLALQGEGKDEYALFKAEIFVDGQMVSSAHKRETRGGFDDFIEKSETGAIGRALAMAGFGTQFSCDELDEKDRLADAPIAPKETTETVTAIDSTRRSSFRKSVAVVPATTTTSDDI